MIKYLVDSDFFIDLLRGKNKAIEFFEVVNHSELAISAVAVAEILEGLVGTKNYKKVKKELLKIKIININFEVAEVFAKQRFLMRKKGLLIDNMDLLIVSTALVHKFTLVTRNKRHFKRIKMLKIQD